MLDGDFPGLDDLLGATPDDILQTLTTFVLALYGQPAETSIAAARFTFYTRNKKSPKVKALPPTSPNLFLHVLRAHLQTMMWKAADQQPPPGESMDRPITDYGWSIQDDVPVPGVAEGIQLHHSCVNVINCLCKVGGGGSAAQRHAALIENTSPAPITATVVGKMAAAIPI